MKFFMVSKCGEGAGLLYKIQKEGNLCQLFIKEKDYSHNYDGILTKGNLDSSFIDKDTIIIFDMSGMGDTADYFRKRGFLVFGGSSWADKLEHDREYGMECMDKNGISTPWTVNFKGSEFYQAKKFTYQQEDRAKFVFKPSGDDLPSRLTYCACDMDDLRGYLEYVEKYYKNDIKSFILQEFIEGSIISTEYFCGPHGFVNPPNHTVEVKHLMNDELGPSTGCSGNSVWSADNESNIVCEGIALIEELCIKEQYIGPIDLNTIISESGEVYGLEWTPRFGYDAMPTFLQLIEGDVGGFISDTIKGQSPKWSLKDKITSGVRVTIPPYPIEPESVKDVKKVGPNFGVPISGIDIDNEHVYWFEILSNEKDDKRSLEHADGTGVICVISDVGDSIEQSFKVPMKLAEKLKIPDKQYRTDLPEKLVKMQESAQEVAYAS